MSSHVILSPDPSQNPAYFPSYLHNSRMFIPEGFPLLFQAPATTYVVYYHAMSRTIGWLLTHLFHTKKRPKNSPSFSFYTTPMTSTPSWVSLLHCI